MVSQEGKRTAMLLIVAQLEGREDDVDILLGFLQEDTAEVLEAVDRLASKLRFESE